MINIKREITNAKAILRSDYVFLHLPRSAGSAIKNNIKSSNYSNKFRLKHHGYSCSMLNYIDKKKIKFCTIRNPYSWYLSIYNSKMMDSQSNLSHLKDYNKMHNNSFADFFDDVVRRKNGPARFKRWFKPFGSYYMDIFHCGNGSVGWCTANLAWYGSGTSDCNKLLNLSVHNFRKHLGMDYILRVENLQEDFNEMAHGTEIDIDLMPEFNKLIHNTKTLSGAGSVSSVYTDEMIRYIQRADSYIFDIFKYEKHPT